MNVFVIRVLEVQLDEDEYSYHQLETNERFGPFPSVIAMTNHIHGRILEDILEAVNRRYN